MYGGDESKYDSPHGDEDIVFEEEGLLDKLPIGKAQELMPVAIDLAKKHWWKAVAVIIVLLLGLFLFDFFIGSYRNVAITIEDTEGNMIGEATARVYAADNTTVLAEIRGSASASLKEGNYPIKVSAAGYKTLPGDSITVSGNSPVTIILEKNMDIEIGGNIPSALVAGEAREVEINITNNDPQTHSIRFVFDGACGNEYMDVLYETPISMAAGSRSITITLEVNEDVEATEGKRCTIRVRGLDNSGAEIRSEIDFIEFDSSEVRVSRSSLDFGRAKAGGPVEKDIKITNNNKEFTMENIVFSIDIGSAPNHSASEVEGWFIFSPDNTIEALEGGSRNAQTINIIVSVPETAKDDIIDGTLVIETTYWKKELNIDLDVEGGKIELEIQGLDPEYTINYDSDTGRYEQKTDQLELKNSGNIAFTLIKIPTPEEGFCSTTTEWVTITTDEFDEILPGENESTFLRIKVPDSATKNDTVNCKIMALFYVGGERQSEEFPFLITTRD